MAELPPSIKSSRHGSDALAGRRALAEVREAKGQVNVIVTSAYLDLTVDDDGEPGRLFQFV